jgi:hypothetical protein
MRLENIKEIITAGRIVAGYGSECHWSHGWRKAAMYENYKYKICFYSRKLPMTPIINTKNLFNTR